MEKTEYELILKIVERAHKELNLKQASITTFMDIENAHITNPLRLEELLKANHFEFAHDVYGISGNINRETKQLDNYFVPRFSV